jgi:cytochrome c-type biogenesis protein CcmH/NrfG
MLSLLCVAVVFGIHSFADWTWYVPGNACVALLCAGWLAGRGPIERAGAGVPLEDRDATLPAGVADAREAAGPRAAGDSPTTSSTSLRQRLRTGELHPGRAVVAGAVIVAALLAAWAQWQPQRSSDSSQQALALLASYPGRAEAAARAAVARDPLSAQALFTLATVQKASGQPVLARGTLQRAVRLQPSNPQTWLTLGEYDLAERQPLAARNELAAAIYLNPESIAPEAIAAGNAEAIAIQNSYVEALRATTLPPAPATARRPSR